MVIMIITIIISIVIMIIMKVACADPDLCEAICQSRAGCTNIAFVKLVTELMPVVIILITSITLA